MPIFRPTFLVAISLIFLFLSVSARPPQSPLAQQEPPTNNLCYFFEIFTDIKRCRHHCHREVVTSTETCTVTRTKIRTTTRLSIVTSPRPKPSTETLTVTLPTEGCRNPITKTVTVTLPGRGGASSRTRTTTREIISTTIAAPPTGLPDVPGSPPERGTTIETTTQFITITETTGRTATETDTETETTTQLANRTLTSTKLILTTKTVIEVPTATVTLTTATVTVTGTTSNTVEFTVTVPVTRIEITTTTTTVSVSVSPTTSVPATTTTPPLPPTNTAPVLAECTRTLNFDNFPRSPSFFSTLPAPTQLYDTIFQGFLLFSPPRGTLIPAFSPPNYIIRQNTSPILFVSADRKDLFSVVSFAAHCNPVKGVNCNVTLRGYSYDDAGKPILRATGTFSAPATGWGIVEVKNEFRDIFSGLAFMNISTDAFLVLDDVVISRRRATCLTET